VTRQTPALLAIAALTVFTACATRPMVNSAPADTGTSRVPNLFGSGN
jgi:hypothetical protein